MGKLITILGGCVIAAGGVSYGVYSHYEGGCAAHAAACAKDAGNSDCCYDMAVVCSAPAGEAVSADACPLAGGGASCCESSKAATLVKAESSCCESSKAAGLVKATPSCCESAGNCDAALAAVAGAAAFAGK